MLSLEREFQRDASQGCLCRLGYPVTMRRAEDSNLHCDPALGVMLTDQRLSLRSYVGDATRVRWRTARRPLV